MELLSKNLYIVEIGQNRVKMEDRSPLTLRDGFTFVYNPAQRKWKNIS